MLLKDNLLKILNRIEKGNNLGEKITLVGATKTMPTTIINEAIENGLKVVAENKVQEFNQKHQFIVGAEQHFIGHLQTNKVKYLIGNVSLIHSVDSLHLAQEISKISAKKGLITNILVEVNIGGELSKSGISPENVFDEVESIKALPNLCVKGLMAMLPKTDDNALKKNLCLQMREIFDKIKEHDNEFTYLSVGMTADYEIAIENGSNMIRIGSLIFGERKIGDL